MRRLVVIDPGLWTTVQDLGRPGYAALGVSASGAADSISLRVGNRLVGNPEDAAALELTLVGGRYAIEGPTVALLAGAGFDARLEVDGVASRLVAPWEPVVIEGEADLRVGASRSGARAYLCLAGGIDLALTLGSAATHVSTGLGGLVGRAVRRGDVLPIGGRAVGRPRHLRGDAPAIEARLFRTELRVTRGAQCEQFGNEIWRRFLEASWEIDERSDRIGLRLTGSTLGHDVAEIASEGVCHGDVQVPAGGSPIVLGPDRPTTGGYPKIASVISADLAPLGQLRPRDRVRFVEVGREEALGILAEQEALIRRLMSP